MSLADRILVVIPTLNEAAHIENCLRSLLSGPDLAGVECIVADGGSSDGTPSVVRSLGQEFPQVRLMDNPARLQAAAVNLGARAGAPSRDILIRCDAHAAYPDRFLLDVAEALEAKGSDSLVVPMDATEEPGGAGCFQRANAWIVDTPLGSGGSAHRGGQKSGFVDHGHHAAFRRDRFLALGGYDETFSHNEDAEYDVRLIAGGGKVYLDAGIRIGYYPRASISGLWRQYFGYGKGRAKNLAKHDRQPRLRQMVPVAHVLLLVGSLVMLPFSVAGWFWPLFYLGLVAGVSVMMTFWKRSLCGLMTGPVLGAMHLAWGLGFLSARFFRLREKVTS